MFETIDHMSNRVTLAALGGLLSGASLAIFRASPLFNTSVSVAVSFALTSTACIIPERVIYNSSFRIVEKCKIDDDSDKVSEIERRRLIGSHIGGGIIGGTISGSLFQRKLSPSGMAVFTPLMIGVAFLELRLKDYRRKRLKEIVASSRNIQ
mmetsp:Transcript_21690/g.32499  ORF Transcript_21690/g.32499 Transcript_21690/m.32499 type:complete len:152 (+) Transcript_21690:27-482(+)